MYVATIRFLRFIPLKLLSPELEWCRARVLEYKVRLKRLIVACCALVFCTGLHFLIAWYMHSSLEQGAQYSAAVATLPAQLGGPIGEGQLDRLVDTLEGLRIGGVQPLLALEFEAAPLNDVIGDDAFNLKATIALARKGRISPVKTDLDSLTAMIDGVQQRNAALYKTFSIASFAITVLILS